MLVEQAPPRTVIPARHRLTLHRPPTPAPPVEADAYGNLLLAALPAADWQGWSHRLERVDMPRGQVLYDSSSRCTHVHFPTTSIVSLMVLMANGDSAEVATVGNDGVIGVPLLLGGHSAMGRAVVQCAGHGYRIKSEVVIDAFNRGGAVMQLLLRYSQALLTQMAQTAACYRHHTVDQQVCRLILLSLDRVRGNHLQMTQELLAGKLGVRRESVTEVALALLRAGLIRYARGSIEVLDREGLEARACECYSVVRLEADRLLQLARAPAADCWARYRGAMANG